MRIVVITEKFKMGELMNLRDVDVLAFRGPARHMVLAEIANASYHDDTFMERWDEASRSTEIRATSLHVWPGSGELGVAFGRRFDYFIEEAA